MSETVAAGDGLSGEPDPAPDSDGSTVATPAVPVNNRQSRRAQARADAKMEKVYARRRAQSERGEGRPRPVQTRTLRDIADTFVPLPEADAVLAGDIEAAEAEQRKMAEVDKRTADLLASIPPRLHDTDECRLLVGRMQASWLAPVSPRQRDRWMAEWLEFVQTQPEATAARARQAGLWVPN